MKTVIVIPARYGSSRFPGKPLMKIAGKEMLLRVWENASKAATKFVGCCVIVATEDSRIMDFCESKGINVMMTSENCLTGTDRVVEVVSNLAEKPEFVVNLQGDNPICPTWFIEAIVGEYYKDNTVQAVTPVVNMKWAELDSLRKSKENSPFSGTTAVFNDKNDAFYFSKNIIPAIRKEDGYRGKSEYSPVYRHIGLYGYKREILENIAKLPEGIYEKLEGLEQLRWLENGIKVRCVKVDYKGFEKMAGLSGVDTPEDIIRVEAVIKEYGDF